MSRVGVRHHHPSGPSPKVVGDGGEDVPHQPTEAMDPTETPRPAEDGRSQEGRKRLNLDSLSCPAGGDSTGCKNNQIMYKLMRKLPFLSLDLFSQ